MNTIIREDINTITSNISEFRSKIAGQKFLVTGGYGFIGSWICDTLIELGANVICVDNLVTGSKNNLEHLEGNKNFRFVQVDISTLEINENVDYVIHLAAIASPLVYTERPVETLLTNTLGTKHILEIARKSKVKGFLFASTSEIYGDPPDNMIPTPETFYGQVSTTGVRAPYHEGKRIGETFCSIYWKNYKVPVRIARIFNTYGPRLDSKLSSSYGRAIVNFIRQSLNGGSLSVFGDGAQTRSFCYITDTITGLLKLLFADGVDGEIFNIGIGKEISIKDLAEKVISITNSKSKIEFKPLPEGDPLRRSPDISKAQKILGFNPVVDLDSGLKRAIQWLQTPNT